MEWIMWYWILKTTGIQNRRWKNLRLSQLMYVSAFSLADLSRWLNLHLLDTCWKEVLEIRQLSKKGLSVLGQNRKLRKDKKIPILPEFLHKAMKKPHYKSKDQHSAGHSGSQIRSNPISLQFVLSTYCKLTFRFGNRIFFYKAYLFALCNFM